MEAPGFENNENSLKPPNSACDSIKKSIFIIHNW
jgi:hypothetical protein